MRPPFTQLPRGLDGWRLPNPGRGFANPRSFPERTGDLQEEVVIMPGQGNWNHDILGSWGEEQMQDWLRYYATEEERRDHLAKYPEDTLPPREKCVADRDRHFPQHP